jgi:hypothetical protein
MENASKSGIHEQAIEPRGFLLEGRHHIFKQTDEILHYEWL